MGIDYAREMLDFMADHRPGVPPILPKGRIIEHTGGQEGYSVFFEASEGSTTGILIDVPGDGTYSWTQLPAMAESPISLPAMVAAYRQAHEFVANMGLREAGVNKGS